MINRLLYTGLTNAAQNRGYSINAREQLAFMTWKRARVITVRVHQNIVITTVRWLKFTTKFVSRIYSRALRTWLRKSYFTVRL